MLRGVREDGRAAEPQTPGSIILSRPQLAVLDPKATLDNSIVAHNKKQNK